MGGSRQGKAEARGTSSGRRRIIIVLAALGVLTLVLLATVGFTSFSDAAPTPGASPSPGVSPSAGASDGPSQSPSPASSSPTSSPAPTSSPSPSSSPSAATSSPSPTPIAVSRPDGDDANTAMDAFNRAFYIETSAGSRFRLAVGSSRPAVFWRTAEMIEMVEDAYGSSHRPAYRGMVVALHRGFMWRFGTSWVNRRYNDDIMWMVIAAIRAYDITGRRAYLDMARRNFDATYARAWSRDFGGGLWWTTDRQEKNACINDPAAIAAALLYKRLHKPSYLSKAKSLYGWVRNHLYEADRGRVNDHVYRSGGGPAVDSSIYTYNQGTFVGAADLLYSITRNATYRRDALRSIDFARSDLTQNGVLRNEGTGDGGGFKGIFIRYAVRFTRRQGIHDYDDWLRQNAQAAWSHRNSGGLIGRDWASPTGSGALPSFDCSSAVVLLQLTAPR